MFSVGLRGIDKKDVTKVTDIVDSTIRQAAKEGFDKQKVHAQLHQMELSLKHIQRFFLFLCFQLSVCVLCVVCYVLCVVLCSCRNCLFAFPFPLSLIIHASYISYIIHHTSYITYHTSYIIHHTSYIIHHTSYIIHHTSHIIHQKYLFSFVHSHEPQQLRPSIALPFAPFVVPPC